MANFLNLPRTVPGAGVPVTDQNRFKTIDANQLMYEVLNLFTSVGITATDSDLEQVTKSIARYTFGNTLIENSGGSTHGPTSDIYLVERDGGDLKKVPTTLLRGLIPVKILNSNQSTNVQFKLTASNPDKDWKKFDLEGNLTELAVGELRANDLVFANYDSDEDAFILKLQLSKDEVEALVGKYSVTSFLDFTTSAPTVGLAIGARYINTTAGTISAGFVGASGTTVVADKIYELYQIDSPSGDYHWREIDPQEGNIVYDFDTKLLYVYNGSIWNQSLSAPATTTTTGVTLYDKYWMWGMIPSSSSGDPDEDVDITVGKALCEDGATIVELLSAETDLSLPTLNGGALSSDTTYHLFRYLKNDDSMQWYLSTSLTPTIGDIKSAKAYRRVLGIIVDSSSDIRHFISIQVGTGYYLSYDIKSVDLSSGSAQSNALIAIAVPAGLNVIADSTFRVESTTDPERGGGTIASYNQTANQEVEAANVNDGVVNKKCVTNTSRQIKNHRVVDVGSPNFFIYTNGYTDNRNYF